MNWKNMGFESYQEYLNSCIWRSKRDLMLELFPICYKCGEEATLVHHLTYKRVCNEKQTDLVTLCKKCHKKIHEVQDGQD